MQSQINYNTYLKIEILFHVKGRNEKNVSQPIKCKRLANASALQAIKIRILI